MNLITVKRWARNVGAEMSVEFGIGAVIVSVGLFLQGINWCLRLLLGARLLPFGWVLILFMALFGVATYFIKDAAR